ncbi:hypothetical protein DFA_05369 [Cavenderia fasciculata]|uniref:Uncharacterized protein n=1 Tax=Cavenderia fasciculata TaxID=261658 RepID=F4PL15_CACFS|nr:uncharacterized protein DFA_05369 [Cavenderia fasciculata]EGG23237.1 hypothetical protein DFA_05369 [Cavenderia fasciculata]|eukprot:XP_004361088.1 hypothetical protein DFA_05369 [Cavenderia fasciculata]
MTTEVKFTDSLKNFSNNLNRGGLAKAFDWYHAKYVKTGSFAVVIHAMAGITLFSYIIRHDRIAHHKTAPKH